MIQLGDAIRRRLPILFALIMGVGAVVIMRAIITQENRKVERLRQQLLAEYQDPVEVVVASQDLAEGVALNSNHLKMAAVPEKFVQPYAVRSSREILGLVTVAPIAEGEQLLLNKVRRPEAVAADATLSSLTPEGKRAVTIGVDAVTGVGGFVRPGDTVDVLWTFKLSGLDGKSEQFVMMTLFQSVPVLAVGGQMMGRQLPAAEAQPGSQQARDYTVTLALEPQEISFLLFAREQGRIQLSLRPQREKDSQLAIAPTSIETVLEAKLGIKPMESPEPPKPARQVEIYKGLERDVVLLSEEK